MKRLLAIAISLVLSACIQTGEPPRTGQDENADLQTQEHTQESTGEEQPRWGIADAGRYASPPPGAPAVSEPRADRAPPPRSRRDAASAPAPTTAPAAPRGEAERSYAFDEAPSKGKSSAGVGSGGAYEGAPRADSRGALRPNPSPAPVPEDRPGLGTSWGETRYSSVSEIPFERDGDSPSYASSLHYNDERGARALAGDGRLSNAQVSLGGALTVSLRDEYGSALQAYRGGGRTVAIGAHGQRYTIVVRNHTNERFEVVLSVDGLDVLDGRDAGYAKRGYIIDPYGVLEIEGFRQSADAVAAFRFGAVSDSYAARTGSARNVGVIGAAAFGERGYMARLRAYQERMYAQRINYREVQRRIDANPFPNGYAQPPLNIAR